MKISAAIYMQSRNTESDLEITKPFYNGKPMYKYILDTLMSIERITDIYALSTDNTIKDILPKQVKFLKLSTEGGFFPGNMDTDWISSEILDRISADFYIYTKATSPFIFAESIQMGIDAIEEGYDSAFSVRKLMNNPLNYYIPTDKQYYNLPNIQRVPELCSETKGFYIFNKNIRTSPNKAIGSNPKQIEISPFESVDINNQADFELADKMLSAQHNRGF